MQTTHAGEEYESGHRRAVLIPDPSAMTDVLEADHKVTSYGVLRFADYSGADIQGLVDEAVGWLAQTIPVHDDAAREELDHLFDLRDRRSEGSEQA